MALHTLLGANGTIANALIPVLKENKETIRLVSRNPKPVAGTATFAADLLDREAVCRAVAGSDVVYLLIGLAYDHRVWRRDWPVIMRNVIVACQQADAKLIFFDDVYMYGKVKGGMTEETPYRPCSRKGRVREEVARMLEEAIKVGSIQAIIARAVDFYGPGVTDKSAPGVYVFSNLAKGRKAQWPINADVPRSFSYTPDAAKALYLLATHGHAFGQTWHLPSVQPALTGREFTALAAKAMQAPGKVSVLPKWLLGIIGLFNPFMREAYEMNYQDEFAFRFDSSKFEKAFGFTPTPYEVGIKATADWYLRQDRSPAKTTAIASLPT
ncbi:NAD-dependent epimerase/dehydratase family protein [Rufibacter sediminis]|uniref:NAD-dependent epimerase/dehydratase family protein n=1 Tax=Rufibacter sediminis TaxID=2762756 RepID=A0ABR6VP87_9BACT|nr:NAD-dependent epimerase/dehydratase family protein [Rufibacter sediminis]MBC3539012.1 NAD-dependent epimerase/dehydratase family protein [Rufibacter sediminis]